MVLIFVGLSYLLTLIFGGLFISQGQLTVGELVTFITYLDMLVWPLQAMGYLFNISQRGAVPKGDEQLFDEYRPRVERLVKEQSNMATKYLAEARNKMSSDDKKVIEIGRASCRERV